jgi:hypothetical protein
MIIAEDYRGGLSERIIGEDYRGEQGEVVDVDWGIWRTIIADDYRGEARGGYRLGSLEDDYRGGLYREIQHQPRRAHQHRPIG